MTSQATPQAAPLPKECRIFFSHEVAKDFNGREKTEPLRRLAEKAIRAEPEGAGIWFKKMVIGNKGFGLTSTISKKDTLDITVGYVPFGMRARVITMADYRKNRKPSKKEMALFADESDAE